MGSSGINASTWGHLLSSTQPAMKTFVALAALSSVLALAFADGSDFADCAGKDNSEYVSQYTLNIKPDPIVAKKDEQVAIHFNADVIKAFPARLDPALTRLSSCWMLSLTICGPSLPQLAR